jgi:hypothetical protein
MSEWDSAARKFPQRVRTSQRAFAQPTLLILLCSIHLSLLVSYIAPSIITCLPRSYLFLFIHTLVQPTHLVYNTSLTRFIASGWDEPTTGTNTAAWVESTAAAGVDAEYSGMDPESISKHDGGPGDDTCRK